MLIRTKDDTAIYLNTSLVRFVSLTKSGLLTVSFSSNDYWTFKQWDDTQISGIAVSQPSWNTLMKFLSDGGRA